MSVLGTRVLIGYLDPVGLKVDRKWSIWEHFMVRPRDARWVGVKELKSSYYDPETIFFGISNGVAMTQETCCLLCRFYGRCNLNSALQQKASLGGSTQEASQYDIFGLAMFRFGACSSALRTQRLNSSKLGPIRVSSAVSHIVPAFLDLPTIVRVYGPNFWYFGDPGRTAILLSWLTQPPFSVLHHPQGCPYLGPFSAN